MGRRSSGGSACQRYDLVGVALDDGRLRRRADDVIDNGGSPTGLRAEVERVFEAAARSGDE